MATPEITWRKQKTKEKKKKLCNSAKFVAHKFSEHFRWNFEVGGLF